MGGLAYYNEVDAHAAEWLRNLIAAGHIMPGDVDTRSIVDVRPADVAGYERCHFFAGIAGWDYALRLAGWPVGQRVWTGSCPCQPFSAAGRQAGFADERHLWPVWFDLIRQCRPDIVLGEQVEAAVRLGWLDTVFSDLEGEGYACGAAVLGAHSVGAPHIRQRLWFVADAAKSGRRDAEGPGANRVGARPLQGGGQGQSGLREPQRGGRAIWLGDAERIGVRGEGHRPDASAARGMPHQDGERERLRADVGAASAVGRLGVSAGVRCEWLRDQPAHIEPVQADPWNGADWIACRDGKARPTQPGLQPLAHGISGRVGKLRAAGNAIVPQAAAAFIGACLDVLPLPLADAGGRS